MSSTQQTKPNPANGNQYATQAAVVKTTRVRSARTRVRRRVVGDTSVSLAWDNASCWYPRNATLIITNTPAYTSTGAALSLVSAIHAVEKGISEVMNRWAKFHHISFVVASWANSKRR